MVENRKILFNNKTGEVNSESDFNGNLVKKMSDHTINNDFEI